MQPSRKRHGNRKDMHREPIPHTLAHTHSSMHTMRSRKDKWKTVGFISWTPMHGTEWTNTTKTRNQHGTKRPNDQGKSNQQQQQSNRIDYATAHTRRQWAVAATEANFVCVYLWTEPSPLVLRCALETLSHSRAISFLFTIPIPSFIAQHNHFLTGKRYGRVLLQLFLDDVVCVFSISFGAQSIVIFFRGLFLTVVKYYLTICVYFFGLFFNVFDELYISRM